MSAPDIGGTSRLIVTPFEDAEDVFRRIDTRLSLVEQRLARLETDRAVSEEKRKFMERRFNDLDSRLDQIDGHISRLVWLILATIIGGWLTYLMRGVVFAL